MLDRNQSSYQTYTLDLEVKDSDVFYWEETRFFYAFNFLGNQDISGDMTGYLEWEVNLVNRVTRSDGSIEEEKTHMPYHVCT